MNSSFDIRKLPAFALISLAVLTPVVPSLHAASSSVMTSNTVAVGDLNGDGLPDAVTAAIQSYLANQIFLNDGAGGWTAAIDLTMEFASYANVALADVDGDSDLDVVLSNRHGGPTGAFLQIAFNQGGVQMGNLGEFNLGPVFGPDDEALSSQGVTVALGNLDDDSDLDLFVLVGEGNFLGEGGAFLANQIWFNDGTGTFTDSGQRLGNTGWYDIDLGDIDSDGDLDALVLNTFADPMLIEKGKGQVWLNDGTGIFSAGQELSVAGDIRYTDVALGHLNLDTHLDAFIIDEYSGEGWVWLNNGSGLFSTTTERVVDLMSQFGPSFDVAIADLDSDGKQDVVVGMNGDNPTRLFVNDGSASFSGGTPVLHANAEGFALVDLDDDGDLDGVSIDATTSELRTWINAPLTGSLPKPRITSPIPRSAVHIYDAKYELTLEVTVDGDVSQVANVQLYTGDRLIGTDMNPPWRFIDKFVPSSREADYVEYEPRLITLDNTVISGPRAIYFVDDSDQSCIIEFLSGLAEYILSGSGIHYSIKSSSVSPFTRLPKIAAAANALDLDPYRRFRDEILAATPAGQYYSDLYGRLSLAMLLAIAADDSFVLDTHQALVDWTPSIQALVDGQGGTVAITPEMITQAQTILADLRAVATGDLAAAMDAETAALDPSTWSGMMIDDLLDRVESRRVPASAIRLSIERSPGLFTLRWWTEPDRLHRIQRSIGDLNSFQPLGEWRPGTGDYLTEEVDISGSDTAYFYLEMQE